MDQPPVRFEDVKNTKARRLLELSHRELDKLIEQADRELDRAETRAYWLRGIKLEKTLREDLASQDGGNHE